MATGMFQQDLEMDTSRAVHSRSRILSENSAERDRRQSCERNETFLVYKPSSCDYFMRT